VAPDVALRVAHAEEATVPVATQAPARALRDRRPLDNSTLALGIVVRDVLGRVSREGLGHRRLNKSGPYRDLVSEFGQLAGR